MLKYIKSVTPVPLRLAVLIAAVAAVTVLSIAACGSEDEGSPAAGSTSIYDPMVIPEITEPEQPLKAPSEVPPELSTVWEVWAYLTQDYVDRSSLDPEKLSEAAIRGMLAALDDPHTSYISPEMFSIENEDYLGEFQGIGAEVEMRRDGFLMIRAPMPGSPAEKAGLKPGDVVLAVDGVSIEGLSLLEAVALIRGPKDSPVILLVKHLTETEPVEIEVIRGVIPLVSVVLRSEPGAEIAHIRLVQFFPDTAQQLFEMIEEQRDAGAKGLILDVRNNVGGLLSSTVNVASVFLDGDGTVVYEVDGHGRRKDWMATDVPSVNIPMVLLVNEFSASASEVLAGALQDYERATIIGATTYGKAAVNVFRPLNNGGGLYITYGKWFTPTGRSLHDKGVTPDIQVLAVDPRDADVKQLEKAFEVLAEMIQEGSPSAAVK